MKINDKKIYLFGASTYGVKSYNELKERYNIAGFFDNNANLLGKVITDGIKIVPITNFENDNSDSHIFITSTYAYEISKQLDELGIKNYSFYPCLEYESLKCEDEKQVNIELRRNIDLCAKNLFVKLNSINIEELDISDYNKRYLSSKNWISMYDYSSIMYSLLSKFPNISNFLDYGGGSGLLSLLAIECGVRNVFYNDIYDVSSADALVIATALGYRRKDYIVGDIDQVVNYCIASNTLFDAVGSFDVFEHIYDLKSFFANLTEIVAKKNIISMASGANPYNGEIFESLSVGHLRKEFLDETPKYGHKERDSLKSYFDLRCGIIGEYLTSHNIALNKLERLGFAYLTRGMRKDEIENALDRYLSSGEYPKADTFGIFRYNTCDPLTGNWQEHLVDMDKLATYLKSLCYEVNIAFYGKEGAKGAATMHLNLEYYFKTSPISAPM